MNAAVVTTFFKKTAGRLAVIVISLLYVAGSLYWQANNFGSLDPKPTILHLDQKSLNRTTEVEVGLHIENFETFSIQRNEFTLHGIVWFKFPVGTESLKTIKQFTVENNFMLYSGETVYKYPPIIRVIDDNVLVSYNVIITFKTNLVYKNFPLGDHRICIQLEHKNVTPYEMTHISKPENLTFGKDMQYLLADWRPTAKMVETGYRKSELAGADPSMEISYPATIFIVNFEPIGYRDLVSLYFPMLVLFFISLFCLLLDVTDLSRLSYAATAIPVLVLFRMVIDAVSPRVGYTTHLDYMYYVLVFLSLLIILFQAFVLLVFHKHTLNGEQMPEAIKFKLESMNDIMFSIILILLIGLTTYAYFR